MWPPRWRRRLAGRWRPYPNRSILGKGARGQGAWAKRKFRPCVQMFAYYARYGLPGNPNVLGWLLGRPPTPYAAFAARVAMARGL